MKGAVGAAALGGASVAFAGEKAKTMKIEALVRGRDKFLGV